MASLYFKPLLRHLHDGMNEIMKVNSANDGRVLMKCHYYMYCHDMHQLMARFKSLFRFIADTKIWATDL